MNDECQWCGRKCDGRLCGKCSYQWSVRWREMEAERKMLKRGNESLREQHRRITAKKK